MYSSIMGPTNTQAHNLNLVLQRIKGDGPVSRADIARTLKCSKSTVTGIITQLIEYGLVREIGKGNPATGRKSTLLEFNPQAKFVIAVDSRPEYSNLAVMDLSGKTVSALALRSRDTKPDLFTANLISGVGELIAGSGIDKEQFIAIGIMISGIVDCAAGLVLYSALMGWDETVDLAGPLRKAFSIPVFIENDVNALALAEFWLGCGRESSSIAYLYLDKKIGGAFIDDGFIIQGADFAFAEFGKLIVSGDKGPVQLENTLSIPALLTRFGIAVDSKNKEESALKTQLADFFIRYPDRRNEVLAYLVESLSQAISIIVAILNPGTIILGGFAYFDRASIEILTEKSKNLLPKRPHRTISIVTASLHDRLEILGAAAVAIDNTRFKFIIKG